MRMRFRLTTMFAILAIAAITIRFVPPYYSKQRQRLAEQTANSFFSYELDLDRSFQLHCRFSTGAVSPVQWECVGGTSPDQNDDKMLVRCFVATGGRVYVDSVSQHNLGTYVRLWAKHLADSGIDVTLTIDGKNEPVSPTEW